MKYIEVLFTPAEYAFLDQRAQLSETVCVVFDVLRMTSTIVTALANGAEAIMPVGDIADAWAEKKKNPEVLLAGTASRVLIWETLPESSQSEKSRAKLW
jgi:2-phosphosulfolactate phosphatase